MPLLAGGGGRALDPGVGQPDRPADPLGELRQLVPGLLGTLEPRRERAHPLLQLGLAPQRGLQIGVGGVLAGLQRRLVLDLGAQPLPQGHQVVGEQPQPGVAQIGLDNGRPARDGGLPAERFELSAQLIGQILYAREIGLHRVQFPQRLLLALTVLENSGRLFDEGAPPHRVGVQHGVQLSLADDDMHFAADTGVEEQFLDVEQPARIAIELVFAAAIAEHDPRDGDFRVVDGQRTVGVVDGQRHLRAAQRRASRGSGEDDVFHLAAAQRLGPLFAHDPGKGVHDIGLAGAVWTYDARDTRLEAERRSRGEGFETSEGQGLEMHAVGLYRPPLAEPGPGAGPGRPACFSVSPVMVQGTSDDEEAVGSGRKKRRDAEASLADSQAADIAARPTLGKGGGQASAGSACGTSMLSSSESPWCAAAYSASFSA